jgi:SMI1-KNR4 cell-wall
VISFENKIPTNVTNAMLEETQRALTMTFPDDYKRFLLQFNGGRPIPNFLPIPDLDTKVAIDSFFGIARPYLDLKEWNLELRYSLDMPEKFLAIAFDVTGNKLIMDTEAPKESSVYYWDSARQFELSSDDKNAFLVADSFSTLLMRFEKTL